MVENGQANAKLFSKPVQGDKAIKDSDRVKNLRKVIASVESESFFNVKATGSECGRQSVKAFEKVC
jgi:hypothetical protein